MYNHPRTALTAPKTGTPPNATPQHASTTQPPVTYTTPAYARITTTPRYNTPAPNPHHPQPAPPPPTVANTSNGGSLGAHTEANDPSHGQNPPTNFGFRTD
jgi:hypothetical protein